MVAAVDVLAPALAASAANAGLIVGLVSRIAALEGRPAPIVKFTVSITLGALALGTREWVLSVPGVKAGDLLSAAPNADLPSGVSIAYVRAPADNTVEIALVAALAVTSASPITFTLAALRG